MNQQVILNLMDFNHEELNTTFNQLSIRMRNSIIRFSMNFEEIGKIILGSSDPSDVKISQSSNCIVVSDELCGIKIFDLNSLNLLTEFGCDSMYGMFIERNYNNHMNDAIYFGGSKETVKHRVGNLLNMETRSQYLWKTELLGKYGMAMRKIGNQKELFRFTHEGCLMEILNAENGSTIRKIKFQEINFGTCLLFISSTRLIINDIKSRKCYIYDEVNENEWKVFKTVYHDNELTLGMAIDRKGEKIFLSDYSNRKIIVLNLEGDELFSLTTDFNPVGMDFDERTGLLYVADLEFNLIRIFK